MVADIALVYRTTMYINKIPSTTKKSNSSLSKPGLAI